MSTLARLKEFWSVYILVHKLYLYFVYIINEIIFLLSLQVVLFLLGNILNKCVCRLKEKCFYQV